MTEKLNTKLSDLKESQRETIRLKDVIVEAILDKKGHDVVSLDLRNISEAITDFFIICHGDSSTQVGAIADNVMKQVKQELGENPWHREGLQQQEWILLDYIDVVVHIFYREKREFYQLEELWDDAVKATHQDIPTAAYAR